MKSGKSLGIQQVPEHTRLDMRSKTMRQATFSSEMKRNFETEPCEALMEFYCRTTLSTSRDTSLMSLAIGEHDSSLTFDDVSYLSLFPKVQAQKRLRSNQKVHLRLSCNSNRQSARSHIHSMYSHSSRMFSSPAPHRLHFPIHLRQFHPVSTQLLPLQCINSTR